LSRDELQQRLNAKRIGSNVYYPTPIHKQPLYRNLGYNYSLPVSEAIAKKVLSLPVHPGLVNAELETIVEALRGN
jgi:perosamine synthetase